MNFKLIAEKGAVSSESTFHNQHLSLSFSGVKFRYAILDLTTQTFSYFKEYQLNSFAEAEHVVVLNEIIKQDEGLKKEFKSISLSYQKRGNTIIPAALFSKDLAEKYLDFNTIQTNASANSNYLPNLNAYNVYGILPELEELFEKRFPSIKIFHYASIIAETQLTQYISEQKIVINAVVFDEFFDIIIVESGKLLFQNAFKFHSVDDIVYFILFVVKELKVNFEAVTLNLYGDKEIITPAKKSIQPYLKNISFDNLNITFKTNIVGNDTVVSNIDTFYQYLCV